GVMVVARTEIAQGALAEQFRAHSLERSYLGLLMGTLPFDARTVVSGHARDANDRRRFAPVARGAGVREAKTHLRVERRLQGATLVRFTLHTGRTHQIRMHARALGHPILGDELYGYRPRNEEIAKVIRGIGRQALHAEVLGFEHPATGETMRFEAPLPAPMAAAVEQLSE
ncbi:MAG: RluA family pseudouridine synthase, partial [Nannocystaceae bacterium]